MDLNICDLRSPRRSAVTSTGRVATVWLLRAAAVDPVPEIAASAGRENMLHVDAAYGGAIALLPEAFI